MKSEQVTRAWEFYRGNHQCFKEPMRREFRKLDDYVEGIESENASLRGAAQGLGDLCDRYKAENAILKERIVELEYERMMLLLELAGEWIRAKQRELGVGE